MGKTDDYKQTSDRLKYEFDKTFKRIKNPPKFSLIMYLNKECGEEEVVRALGRLREQKNFREIKDYSPYLVSICQKTN